MPSRRQLLHAADALFTDLGANAPPLTLMSHFSLNQPISVQHCPKECPNPQTSKLVGWGAVRSYFDLLVMNWDRSEPDRKTITAYEDRREVIIRASIRWTWKASGRSWVEEFTARLKYDDDIDHPRVVEFLIRTESESGTCAMRAVDKDLDKMLVDAEGEKIPVKCLSSLDFERNWEERRNQWIVTEKAMGWGMGL